MQRFVITGGGDWYVSIADLDVKGSRSLPSLQSTMRLKLDIKSSPRRGKVVSAITNVHLKIRPRSLNESSTLASP